MLHRTNDDINCIPNVPSRFALWRNLNELGPPLHKVLQCGFLNDDAHLKAPLAAMLTVLALISVPLPWQLNSTWHTGEPACSHAETQSASSVSRLRNAPATWLFKRALS